MIRKAAFDAVDLTQAAAYRNCYSNGILAMIVAGQINK